MKAAKRTLRDANHPHAATSRNKAKRSKKMDASTRKKATEEHKAAIAYCQQNSCRGWTALRKNPQWEHITARTINQRLDGVVANGSENWEKAILTREEEASLVLWIEQCSHNTQPRSRAQIRDMIRNLLARRVVGQARMTSSKRKPLSRAATNCLRGMGPSDDWFGVSFR